MAEDRSASHDLAYEVVFMGFRDLYIIDPADLGVEPSGISFISM